MFQQDEQDLERIMSHELQMFGTDGLPLRGKKAHPRLYGTYPRVLGTYVRQKGLFSLERAVAKMTCLPANRLGLLDRGLLRPGLAADITIFDPSTVEDRSTYQEPATHPEGIAAVIVNGVPVLVEGTLTGRLPGQALKINRK
jgi:N-acyl-D-amino-acid deacylase